LNGLLKNMGITTTLFYITGATLLTIVAVFMFGSYLRSQKRATFYLALCFLFLGIHAYAFALPVIIDRNNMSLLAYGYMVGISFIFLTMIAGFGVLRFVAPAFFTGPIASLIKAMVWFVWLTTLALLIFDFRTPILEPGGIILWNANRVAGWLIGLSGFFYGIMWSVIFFNARKLVQNFYSRFKLMVIGADGLLMGTIALLVHTSQTPFQTILGHILFVVAGVITIAIYIIPGNFFERGGDNQPRSR